MITEQNIQQLNLGVNIIHLLKKLYKGYCIQEVLETNGKIAGYHIILPSKDGFEFTGTCNKDQFLTLLENGLVIERKLWPDQWVKTYAIHFTGTQVLKKLDVDWEI